ncbi:MAG: S8 family serine peptidase [Deltaproteobacteria bacterium]|nr:S8 family serine peptidase [Deltaproteobacteria bacterium]MBW2695933.1 S8 family serine peptidase [Deltaproteobacteria bacterium]
MQNRIHKLTIALLLGPLTAASLAVAQQPDRIAELRARTQRVADLDLIERLESGERPRVIVYLSGPPGEGRRTADLVHSGLSDQEFRSARRFQRLPVLTGSVSAAGLTRLADDPRVVRVSLDPRVRAQLDQARQLVEADALHARSVTGSGALGVIIDTGVDLDHPDLSGSVADEACFCRGDAGASGCCPNGLDTQTGAGAGQDDHGHGTRVAGIVVSAAVHAGLGIAPTAMIISIKVLDTAGGGFASDVILAMDWVLENHSEADVVSVSLGGGLYDGDCDSADATTLAYANAIGQLRDAGILTVAGAGNDGSGAGMIAPACVAAALSVGAVWDDFQGQRTAHGCTDATTAPDQVACFSNSSATTDVFAPGGMTESSGLDGTTLFGSGTSYATPVVSGCALLVRSIFPMLTPDDLEQAVEDSSTWVTDDTNGLSFPRVDCNQAFTSFSPPVPALGRDGSGLVGLAILALSLGTSALWRLSSQARGGTAQSRRPDPAV